MCINIRQETIVIGGSLEEDVEEPVATGEDISQRTRNTRQVCYPLFSPKVLCHLIQHKIRIFKAKVRSVILYGSGTWRIMSGSKKKIYSFINKYLWQILQLKWYDRVPNKIFGYT